MKILQIIVDLPLAVLWNIPVLFNWTVADKEKTGLQNVIIHS